MREIFINEFGRLRSGWRLAIYILAVFALSFFLITVQRIIYVNLMEMDVRIPPHDSPVWNLIYRFIVLATALIAGYLCARILERLPWRSLGLTLHSAWLRDLVLGSVLGFAAIVVAVAITMIGSGLRFSFGDDGLPAIGRSMIGSTMLLLVAALAEEAMFRGYGLQTLARARLAWLGVLLTCVFFGLVHLANPNVVPGFTMVNTALAGVMFGVAYLRTRSLWFPWGIHWAWNWALGWFFGLPVSGMKVASHTLLEANDTGPFWLTGGSYGIEGGVAGTISLLLLTIFVWRTSWISATPELLKLTSEENPALR